MKVTYQWLKDFVEIIVTPEALAAKLTMAGIEVKSIDRKEDDYVFEIEITSNRPDWLSVVGIAREVAALTGKKLKNPPASAAVKPAGRAAAHFTIAIEDKKDCPLYTAKIIRGVAVGPSPEWLRKRLALVGCRSVNNIVDITNYVLFEMGEPLHAFDLNKLEPGSIIVRRAKPQEELVSIDGESRKLGPDILVIADKNKPVAIAGVMGGQASEVTGQTTDVLLEAAVFDPVIVRRGRQKLGMQSEAAYRFERGVDVQAVEAASRRTVEMILKNAGGAYSQAQSSPLPHKKPAPIIFFEQDIRRHLGLAIPLAQANQILLRLGFSVRPKTKDSLLVSVPSWRQDVRGAIDLIEEIARIYGFEKIPATLPRVLLKPEVREADDYIPLITDILKGLGLTEVVTYSLIDKKSLHGFWDHDEALIGIANPLSQEQELLRPLLSPSLARCVAYNLRQKQNSIALFEVAKTYRKANQKICEEYTIGIALCGTKTVWVEPGNSHILDEAGFLHLKGIMDTLFLRFGIPERTYTMANGREVSVEVGGQIIATFKKLSRQILEQLDVKNRDIFAAEISLAGLLAKARREKEFVPFPRLPDMARDISLVVKDDVSVEAVTAAIARRGGALVQEVKITDYYRGQPIAAGYKNLTVSCYYCSAERTLTEAQINPLHEEIKKTLQEKFSAQIR